MENYNLKFKYLPTRTVKIISCLVMIILFVAMNIVLADEVTENDYVYQLHLYYNGKEVVLDDDFKFDYDIVVGKYNQGGVNEIFYRGEIINFLGKVSKTFQFPAPNRVGKFSIRAPYVPDGDKLTIYNPQNAEILSIDISGSSYCNDDGICQDSRGEDSLSCPNDCKAPAEENNTNNQSSAKNNSVLFGLLFLLIGIIMAGFLGYRAYKSRQSIKLPPQQ